MGAAEVGWVALRLSVLEPYKISISPRLPIVALGKCWKVDIEMSWKKTAFLMCYLALVMS